ncbi:SPFH domain-containing protein [Micromonospora sp. WMMD882]|uniref:SPFH domain-containing protein n=1 Tax=Micromonospora sp. WMMD882 TaxID=3015151 RepID=UPI00248B172B|nr:SPFH domain-containing protein [Micromonospora sp. WMMD882]WBB81066.1 SPFH domain-containing protein [Micromonospora sp. WMMD882]
MGAAVVVGLIVVAVLVTMLAVLGVRLVQQHQRGVVFRFGRALDRVRRPGLRLIVPIAERMVRVNVQTVVLDVPAQQAVTRDQVTLTVDAVIRHRVVDPVRALVDVRDYPWAVRQVAQTALRTVIGRTDLDRVLGDRERLNAELTASVDAVTARPWGVLVERLEIRDVTLPEPMRRSMGRQAEAERERRARVTVADGEAQAARRLAEASRVMAATPGTYRLRLLEAMVEVVARTNSTLVLPVPAELWQLLDREPAGAGPAAGDGGDGRHDRRDPPRWEREGPAAGPSSDPRSGTPVTGSSRRDGYR